MTQSDAVVSVRHLSMRYGATVALHSLDFDVRTGDVVGLLGPNGAGKTTCMRILSGFLRPTAGEVRVAGIDVCRDRLAAQRFIGYLPEGAPLYPELRVDEYLRFRARLRGFAGKGLSVEVDRVAELCALGSARRRLTRQLSRGFRQRVGLADALIGRPELLILDEPTAGLDPNQVRQVRALVRAAAGEQTVLLSTHILSEVEALCQRVLIVDRGRLVAQGDVAEVCRRHGLDEVSLELRGGTTAEVERRLCQLTSVENVVVTARADDPEAICCQLKGAFDAIAMEQLVTVVGEAGWALRELRRERGQLEQIFARLTEGTPER